MNIRHFTAPDARRAIRMIREALGADAVILSNRRTEIGVEMVAAVDYPDQAAKPEATGGVGPAPADDSGPALQAQAVDEIRQEVAMLRRMLESQATGLASNNEARRQPIRSQAAQFLAKLGITDDVSSSVISSLGKIGTFDDARRRSLQELAQRLPVLDDDIVDQGGRFALVGPTGVGKTTAIAKLAARFTLRNPAGDLALVTTDTYRVGAVDQLRAFGNMLGVPVHVASDGAALQTTLAGLDARLVLIDTTGVGQRDQRLAEQFDSLRASLPVRYLLTIPANAQTEAMDEIVDAFAPLRPEACILTKIDEAASLGGAISTILRRDLPLAFLSPGQRVPADLLHARGRREWLLRIAVARTRDRQGAIAEDQTVAEQERDVEHAPA